MDKIVEKYSLKEISERTHISPVVLEKLLKYNFSSISEIKFKGFIRILENDFPDVSFETLKEKGEEFYKVFNENIKIEPVVEEKSPKKFPIYLFVFVLLILIGSLVVYTKPTTNEINKTEKTDNLISNEKIVSLNKTIEKEQSQTEKVVDENNLTEILPLNNKDKIELNVTNVQEEEKETLIEEVNNTLIVVPKQRVWFRVTYLDTLKRKNYLQATPQELNGSRDMYIEFGHGMESLIFRNKTLTPDTVKKVNFILKDGELNITSKSVEEYK